MREVVERARGNRVMEKWAAEELKYASLGDERRKKRLIRSSKTSRRNQGKVCHKHREVSRQQPRRMIFGASPYLKPDDIRNAHIKSTIERIREHQTVLVIQDITDLDFTHHPATTELGMLDPDFSLRFPKMAYKACEARLLEKSSNKQSVILPDCLERYECSMPLAPKMAQAYERTGGLAKTIRI